MKFPVCQSPGVICNAKYCPALHPSGNPSKMYNLRSDLEIQSMKFNQNDLFLQWRRHFLLQILSRTHIYVSYVEVD